MSKLLIKNLHVSVENKEILHGVNLSISSNETIALLGPNGHGKSTLLQAIMGNPHYAITKGSITLDGKNVLSMTIDERSKAGLFLAMQYPSEVPGVNSAEFLRSAINSREEKPLSLYQFYSKINAAYNEMSIPLEMSNRSLNEGFSGGEKKRNEILQMILLNPKIAMLDEIDSGLDVDALKIVAKAIVKTQKEHEIGFLIISHYARLYSLLKPSKAEIMVNGRIVAEGGPELIDKVDEKGFEWIKDELGIEIEKEEEKMSQQSIGICVTKEAMKNAQ
ncbi:MAG: Fe-S cluster assembly ATPase SufC [Bacilli bacterium]|jgi:Fe-S cluster assembly ATP-binding protein